MGHGTKPSSAKSNWSKGELITNSKVLDTIIGVLGSTVGFMATLEHEPEEQMKLV